MKARPILFSSPMVNAIRREEKTQTRRVVKPQPELTEKCGFAFVDKKGRRFVCGMGFSEEATRRNFLHRCRHGVPGDLLWVRETWYCDDYRVQGGPYLKPDDLNPDTARDDGTLVYAADDRKPYECEQPTWRPSIHMPRWASRLTLRISHVRLQRLHEIDDKDAEAEGVCNGLHDFDCVNGYFPDPAGYCVNGCGSHSYAEVFQRLWKRINGLESWSANPWVWAITFEVIECNVDKVIADGR